MKRSYWQWFLLVLMVLFIGIGIMNDEYIIVLQKAAQICLECIGLG